MTVVPNGLERVRNAGNPLCKFTVCGFHMNAWVLNLLAVLCSGFTHGALSQNVNVAIPRGLPGYTWHKNIDDICGIGEEWQMAKLYNFLKNIFA